MFFMSNIDIVNVGDSPILKVSYFNVPLQVLIISDQEVVNHRKQRSLDTFGAHTLPIQVYQLSSVERAWQSVL